jgi:hypothetical protein
MCVTIATKGNNYEEKGQSLHMRVGCLTTNPMVNHDGSKGGWAK